MRHLLGLEELSRDQIANLLDKAREFLGVGRDSPRRTDLAGKVVANLFYEPSTRTKISFSLAARRLGAKVFSFDFDSNSYACTKELKRRFFDGDADWTIEQGSALDKNYVESLGKFDIVYSWGVLHHTGEMWKGLENASLAVKTGGKLFIAIYNDTGSQAARWHWIKKTYCRLPNFLKSPFAVAAIFPDEAKRFLNFALKGKPLGYISYWKNYRNGRGMNRWHDIIDWVGGFPYEVATVDEIFEFYKAKGFTLQKIKSGGAGLGCNEFVFEKK